MDFMNPGSQKRMMTKWHGSAFAEGIGHGMVRMILRAKIWIL